MNLSKILWDLHHSSDVGNAVEGLAELAVALENERDALSAQNKTFIDFLKGLSELHTYGADEAKELLAGNSEQDLPIHKANTDKLAELALYCVQRKIGRGGQEAHEAIMLYCDVLTAQLELMHQGVLSYLNNSITSRDEEVNWKKLVRILESNPQQCLTEIKAIAIEEAIGECLSAIDDNAAIKLVPFGYLLSEKWLLHYAEKVRRGDE